MNKLFKLWEPFYNSIILIILNITRPVRCEFTTSKGFKRE